MVLNGVTSKASRFVAGVTATTVATFGFAVSNVVAQTPLIQIDGSSTVFPISEAMAEEFMTSYDANVVVGVSGTGGGFRKFCGGETDISGASRPIKPEEMMACAEAGIEWVEIPIAYDALTVVVNPENTWVDSMTVEQLQMIWEPVAEGVITNWNQVDPSFPDEDLSLFGPGADSGTFDYFTDEIVGEEGASRGDYTASEDDNILVVGVQQNMGALGYFGFAYYQENRSSLSSVAIDSGDGPVPPTPQTVNNGTYTPLSRPVFIYVRTDSLSRPEVQAFVDFYIGNAPSVVPFVGYVPLSEAAYTRAEALVDSLEAGTVYHNETSGLEIEEVMNLDRTLISEEG
jgi:phosphate transport system substrate-binding protein